MEVGGAETMLVDVINEQVATNSVHATPPGQHAAAHDAAAQYPAGAHAPRHNPRPPL